MQSMNEVRTAIKHEVLAEEFSQILTFIQTGYQQGYTAHEVESGLWQRMLKLGHDLFQGLVGPVRRWRWRGLGRPGGWARGGPACGLTST